jgi:hypothetical protein
MEGESMIRRLPMKTVLAIGLIVCCGGCGLCLENPRDSGQFSFYGETWWLASGFGASVRSGLRDAKCFELAATYLNRPGFEGVNVYALHLSHLVDVSRRSKGRILLGGGVSVAHIAELSDAPLVLFHAKAAIEVPLGAKAGLRLGSYPLLFVFGPPFIVPFPDLHAGIYVRF